MSTDEWPDPAGGDSEKAEFRLALYQAQLQDEVNRREDAYAAAQGGREQEWRNFEAMVASADALRRDVHAAYLDVAKLILDRMLRRVNLLAIIAASVASIYAALLGLVIRPYSKRTLDLVAGFPAIFLALSLVLAAYYSANVSRRISTAATLQSGTSALVEHRRLAAFVSWANDSAMERSWALHASTTALFVGTATMPVAFMAKDQWLFVVIVTAIAAVILVGSWLASPKVRPAKRSPRP